MGDVPTGTTFTDLGQAGGLVLRNLVQVGICEFRVDGDRFEMVTREGTHIEGVVTSIVHDMRETRSKRFESSTVEIMWGMGPLLGADLWSWFKDNKLSLTEAARNLDTTPATIKRWISRKKRTKELSVWLEQRLVANIRLQSRMNASREENA